MASIKVSGDTKFDLSLINFKSFFDGVGSVEKSELFRVNFGSGDRVDFRGTGFKYKHGIPQKKGEISSIVVYHNGSQGYSLEKLSLKVADAVNAATTTSMADDLALLAKVFKGTDTFVGGKHGDHFVGFDGDDKFKGGGGNDKLEGGKGADKLDGGSGADKMYGGTGNDTYIVDNKHDKIFENVGEGTDDKVQTLRSYTLGGAAEFEYFSTTSKAGTANINLKGNGFGQAIDGNAGDNVIDGKGGNDTLQGFGGHDTFVFSTALDAANNVDTINGYDVGQDKIDLDHNIFGGLTLGNLTEAEFADHFVYGPHGKLFFDVDGTGGGGAAVQFATMASHNGHHPDLTAADFVVI